MPVAGKLLIASRSLRDPNFSRTVVLMLEHNDDGALGLVLNRKTGRTVEDVWREVGFDPCPCAQLLNLGGPVPGPLIALHTSKAHAEKTLLEGSLYLSMQKDVVDPLVRQTDHAFRLYSGNSGWGGGQLEGELLAGGWLLAPARVADVFADEDGLWDEVTRRVALDVLMPGVDPRSVPRDPSVN